MPANVKNWPEMVSAFRFLRASRVFFCWQQGFDSGQVFDREDVEPGPSNARKNPAIIAAITDTRSVFFLMMLVSKV